MNEIYLKDCIDGINDLDDESIDVCIADPPYGIDFQSCRVVNKKDKILNDETPFLDWIHPLFHKMKVGGRLFCFYRFDVQEYFSSEIRKAGFNIKSQIVWDNMIHGMGDLTGEFAPQHELCIYATKGRYEFIGKRPTTVYRDRRVMPNDMIHPNQKPISLMFKIINDISSWGETILDPFSGSGVVTCASYLSGRESIAFELHEGYFDKSILNLTQIKKEKQLIVNPLFGE